MDNVVNNNSSLASQIKTLAESDLAHTFGLLVDRGPAAESLMEYMSSSTKAFVAANIMDGLKSVAFGNSDALRILDEALERRLRKFRSQQEPTHHSQQDPGSLAGLSGPAAYNLPGEEITGHAV
jgi:hypothetical protein